MNYLRYYTFLFLTICMSIFTANNNKIKWQLTYDPNLIIRFTAYTDSHANTPLPSGKTIVECVYKKSGWCFYTKIIETLPCSVDTWVKPPTVIFHEYLAQLPSSEQHIIHREINKFLHLDT